jgi:tetratricopeptide (TPR) repeat protein
MPASSPPTATTPPTPSTTSRGPGLPGGDRPDRAGHAHGWAYLAYLRLDELRYGYAQDPLGRELEAAAAAARRAVELEPGNAVAQRALAAVLFTAGDLEGFLRHAERALDLNPNDSDALADLGGKIAYAGDWERGLAMRTRAMERNPAHPPPTASPSSSTPTGGATTRRPRPSSTASAFRTSS